MCLALRKGVVVRRTRLRNEKDFPRVRIFYLAAGGIPADVDVLVRIRRAKYVSRFAGNGLSRGKLHCGRGAFRSRRRFSLGCGFVRRLRRMRRRAACGAGTLLLRWAGGCDWSPRGRHVGNRLLLLWRLIDLPIDKSNRRRGHFERRDRDILRDSATGEKKGAAKKTTGQRFHPASYTTLLPACN